MEKKEIILKDFDFGSRLDYLLRKKGISREKFYNDSEKLQNAIEWDTFKSYFANGKKKRYPKIETTEIIAEELKIDKDLLNPHHIIGLFQTLFKDNKKLYLEFDYDLIYDSEIEDVYDVYRVIADFKAKFLNGETMYNNASKKIISIIQLYLDSSNFNALTNDIIQLFMKLNEKGKEKFILYGKNIISSFINNDDLYDTNIERLCEKYGLIDEIGDKERYQSSLKIGVINLEEFSKRLEDKVSFDYNFAEFLYWLMDFDLQYLDVVLISNFLDYKNNPVFPQDALESYLLIAQLFSLDNEFCNE